MWLESRGSLEWSRFECLKLCHFHSCTIISGSAISCSVNNALRRRRLCCFLTAHDTCFDRNRETSNNTFGFYYRFLLASKYHRLMLNVLLMKISAVALSYCRQLTFSVYMLDYGTFWLCHIIIIGESSDDSFGMKEKCEQTQAQLSSSAKRSHKEKLNFISSEFGLCALCLAVLLFSASLFRAFFQPHKVFLSSPPRSPQPETVFDKWNWNHSFMFSSFSSVNLFNTWSTRSLSWDRGQFSCVEGSREFLTYFVLNLFFLLRILSGLITCASCCSRYVEKSWKWN